MLLYRLEHYSRANDDVPNVNAGPHRCEEYGDHIAMTAYGMLANPEDYKHPTPSQDLDLCIVWGAMSYPEQERHCFGFESLKSLHKWFPDFMGLAELDKQEIARIGVYEVPDRYFLKGQHQCIARADHCDLVVKLKCTNTTYRA